MTVSSNGTPVIVNTTGVQSPSVTGSFPNGTPAAGDLLVAVVGAYGTTTASVPAAPAGWTLWNWVFGSTAAQLGTGAAGTTTVTAYYVKVASGSDTAPSFTTTTTGTALDQSIRVVIYDLSDSGGGTPVLWSDGKGSNPATAGLTVFTGPCPAGSLGILASLISQGTTSATTTWTAPTTGWNACATNETAAGRSQMATWWTSSAPTTGNGLSVATAHGRTSTAQNGIVLIAAPPGSTGVQRFQASPYQAPTTASNTLTSHAFAAQPNELIVATSGVGNGNGTSAPTSLTATDNNSATLTALAVENPASSSRGIAGVFCENAGSSPTVTSVTVTVLPSPAVQDPCLVVYRFAGAAVTASQTGTTATGTTATLSVTPTQTGSVIVGASGNDGSTALTANATTLAYISTTGGDGDRINAYMGLAYTTATSAVTVGWSTAPTGLANAAAEIIPAPAPPPSTVAAGRSGPVRAPIARQYPQGRIYSSDGTFSGTGPPVPELRQPVKSRLPLRRSGSVRSARGVFSGTGPPLTPLRGPVQARRPLPPRGRAAAMSPLAISYYGPPLTPLRGPVTPAARPLPPRGRVCQTPLRSRVLTNNFEGGTNGVTITTGNSDGISGAAFDTVSIGASATLTFDNTQAAHGLLSMKVSTGGTSTTSLAEWTLSEGTQQQIFFRLYLFISATPTAAISPFFARSGGSAAASLLLTTAGTLQLRNGANATVATFTTHPPTGSWYRVEGYVIGDATAGAISASLYSPLDSLTPVETQTATGINTTGLITQYWFGQANTVASSGPFWIDDIGISPVGFLGPAAFPVATSGPPLTPLKAPVQAQALPRRGGRIIQTPPPPPPPVQIGAAPWYLFPTLPQWPVLEATTGRVPAVVILNNGNGDVIWDSTWGTLATALHAMGIKLLGYVYTTFGARPAADVEAAVGNYLQPGFTPGADTVDGIFLDEFQNLSGDFAYYQGICSSIQSQFAAVGTGANQPLIWGNPGTAIDVSYLALPVDTFVTAESGIVAYQNFTPFNVNDSGFISGAGRWPRQRFAHLVYEVQRDQADGVIDRAYQNYAGWAYTTNGPGDTNPYAFIPGNDYLNDLVLRGQGEPPSLLQGIPPWIYPLRQPVTPASRPLPRRGSAQSRRGVFSGQGPAVAPWRRPVESPRTLPPRGTVRSGRGVFSGTGPPLAALHRPDTPAFRTLPPRGSVLGRHSGAFSGTGPALTPLRGPVQARRPLPPAGRRITRTGVFSGLGPGPKPLHQPVTPATRPLPPRGTVTSRAGVAAGEGPGFTPLRSPVRARPSLPPRGVSATRAGVFSGQGPAPAPLHQPVAARRTLPPRGHTQSNPGGPVTAPPPPTTGPPLYPLHMPVRAAWPKAIRGGTGHGVAGAVSGQGPALPELRQPVTARRPLRRPGHTASSKGTFSGTGPPLTPLQRPVRPQPAITRTGRAAHSPGVFSGTGPAVKALTAPVMTVRTRLRAGGRPVTTIRPRAAQTSGPQLTPPRGPVTARKPPFSRGRANTTPPYAAPFIPTSGPRIYPLHGPLTARPPLPPRGRILFTPAYVLPIPPPTRPIFATGYPRTPWQAGTADGDWDTGDPRSPWAAGVPALAWHTGDTRISWPAGR